MNEHKSKRNDKNVIKYTKQKINGQMFKENIVLCKLRLKKKSLLVEVCYLMEVVVL